MTFPFQAKSSEAAAGEAGSAAPYPPAAPADTAPDPPAAPADTSPDPPAAPSSPPPAPPGRSEEGGERAAGPEEQLARIRVSPGPDPGEQIPSVEIPEEKE